MLVEPRELVSFLPTRAAAFLLRRSVDLEVLLDRSRDQLPQLGRRQRSSPDFSPAASPDSGTTRRAVPGFGGDARRSSSSPDSRPGPPPPWHAGNTLRSGGPPWPRGPTPLTAPPDRNPIDNSHA